MEATCLNCGHKFKVTKILCDELGTHVVCPECGSSFDVDKEKDKKKEEKG